VLSILDANTFIVFSGGNTNLTIPLNANVGFEIGTKIEAFITGAVRLNVVATSGVSIVAPNGLIALNQSTLLLTKIAVNTWYVNIIPKLFLSPDAGFQYSATLSLLNASFISTNALVSPQISGDGGGVATLRALLGGGVNNRWESTVRLRLAAGLTAVNAQDLTPKSYVDAIPNPTTNFLPKKGASGFVDSLIFDNGTNVGIGTITPTEKLDVVGNAKIVGTITSFLSNVNDKRNVFSIIPLGQQGFTGAYNVALRTVYPYESGSFSNDVGGDFDILKGIDGNTILATKKDNTALGNVGIRTTTPTEALDVNGSIKLSNLLKLGQFTTATEPAYVKGASFFNTTLNKSKIGGETIYETQITGTGTTNKLAKFTASGAVENSIITELSNGNVGFGTNNPLTGIHIEGNGNNATFTMRDLAITNALSNSFRIFAAGQNKYAFGVGSVTSFPNNIVIDGFNKFIGLNTTNPTEVLDVVGSINLSNLLKLGQFTTATEPAYVKGASFFNTTLNKMRIGGATAYETVTSS
jgi:hypothetical protein